MCPSYVRIRLPIREALARFERWIELPALASAKKIRLFDVVDKTCKNGQWRSIVAVFVYESGDWTVFEDQTGHLASMSADRWRELAEEAELVFAGYNDAVPYGQLVVVQSGKVVREFLDDQQDPCGNVNRGKLEVERSAPITTWIDAASFVDEDEILSAPEMGLLWMFGKRLNAK